MRVIQLLITLLSRRSQVMAADRDYIVTAIGRRVVDGLVLAHEEQGDGCCDSTE